MICFICKKKLNLIQIIRKCKCEKLFCYQCLKNHSCDFNYRVENQKYLKQKLYKVENKKL